METVIGICVGLIVLVCGLSGLFGVKSSTTVGHHTNLGNLQEAKCLRSKAQDERDWANACLQNGAVSQAEYFFSNATAMEQRAAELEQQS